MAKFTERANDLNAIAREISKWISVNDAAVAEFTRSKDGLTALAVKHSGLIDEIDAEATANPDDEAIQDQKRFKDKLVADFNAEKTRSTSLESAVGGL